MNSIIDKIIIHHDTFLEKEIKPLIESLDLLHLEIIQINIIQNKIKNEDFLSENILQDLIQQQNNNKVYILKYMKEKNIEFFVDVLEQMMTVSLDMQDTISEILIQMKKKLNSLHYLLNCLFQQIEKIPGAIMFMNHEPIILFQNDHLQNMILLFYDQIQECQKIIMEKEKIYQQEIEKMNQYAILYKHYSQNKEM